MSGEYDVCFSTGYGSGPKITFEQNYLKDVLSWSKICFDKKLSFALHVLV